MYSKRSIALGLSGGGVTQPALGDDAVFQPGNLLVSQVFNDNNPSNVAAGVTLLPPNCVGSACVTATASDAYPYVWNNVLVDASFGITSKIVLDQLSPTGSLISSLEVLKSAQDEVPPNNSQ